MVQFPTEKLSSVNIYAIARAPLVSQTVKNLPAEQETQVQFLSQEDLLEKGKATHTSIVGWRIPWT